MKHFQEHIRHSFVVVGRKRESRRDFEDDRKRAMKSERGSGGDVGFLSAEKKKKASSA